MHNNTSFALSSDQSNYILVASESHVTIHIQWNKKDELVFADFFVHPITLLFITNIACNLSKATKGTFVTNVDFNDWLINSCLGSA
jgi:hypothetical protein